MRGYLATHLPRVAVEPINRTDVIGAGPQAATAALTRGCPWVTHELLLMAVARLTSMPSVAGVPRV